jgi:hypothetical protein
MTVILVGGVVTALVIVFVCMKTFAGQPKKATKSEKAEILRQLLARSEEESSVSPSVPSVQSRKPIANQATRSGQSRQKPAGKTYARNQLQNKRENA